MLIQSKKQVVQVKENTASIQGSKLWHLKISQFDTLRMIVYDQTGEPQLQTDHIRQVRGLVLSK